MPFNFFGHQSQQVESSAFSRRSFLRAALASTVVGLTIGGKSWATSTPVSHSLDITQAPFFADQSGNEDSSPGIQAALNIISSSGCGGKLIVPAGNYRLKSPVFCTQSLFVQGDGQASSVFMVDHTDTAITVTVASSLPSVSVRDVGFSAVPSGGSLAGTAVQLNFPNSPSGWQHCSIQDVDFGVARPNYTTFARGLVLTNAWRSSVSRVNMHGSNGVPPGTVFAILNGTSIDNRFTECNVDGIETGVFVGGYCEGLHLTDTVFIGKNAVSTGPNPYSGDGSTSPCVSLLGLYITGCEFNCVASALNLGYVYTGWVVGTHLGTRSPATPVAMIRGCFDVQFSACQFTGEFDKNNPEPFWGIWAQSGGNWPTNKIAITDCSFDRLSVGVHFGAGTINSSAMGIRMSAPGEGQLISAPTTYGAVVCAPFVDASGNSSNTASWIGSQQGVSSPSTKLHYSNP